MIPPAMADAWAAYANAQKFLDPRQLNSRAWAYEDATSAVLDELVVGASSEEDLTRRTFSLVLNRSRKHANRLRLQGLLQARSLPFQDAAEVAMTKEMVLLVRGQASKSEWQLLWSLAEGDSYADLANAHGMTEGQLRAQVHRLRKRIRNVLRGIAQHMN